MQKLAVLCLIFFGTVVGTAQSEKKMPRKVPGASKPECAQGSICFSGEIREGQTFRKDITAGLEFVLGLPGSFQVEIKHAEASCKQLFWVADPPFHAHRPTEIDATYDWTAEQEVETSPREFRFATDNTIQIGAALATIISKIQPSNGTFIYALTTVPFHKQCCQFSELAKVEPNLATDTQRNPNFKTRYRRRCGEIASQ